MRAFALTLALALAGPTPAAADARRDADRPSASDPATPAPAGLYALAVERMLAGAADGAVYVLPSAAGLDLAVRPRRASGPAHVASAATAREVVALLRGRPAARRLAPLGMRDRLAGDGALQLVLGELRFEPEDAPAFARLRIAAVGAGGARQTVEFLLKREGTRWRALSMEAADGIGAAPAPVAPTAPTAPAAAAPAAT